jgi:pSer/pThr/pTyr-binding forkhead associated (FHA) protein
MYKLIIEDDEGKTTEVPIIRDEITIGRKEGNTIRLTERNVSRRHARFSRTGNGLFIEDLLSYNGIKVNGERIQGKVPVNDGDRVQIGDYQVSIKLDKAAVKAPGAPQIAPMQPNVVQSAPTMPQPAVAAPTVTSPAVAAPVKVPEKPARLIVVSTNFARQEFPLDKAAVVIGRTDDNDVVLNHRSISRHHAKIVREGEHFHISDLQSANGVRVNGEEYGKVELRKGDLIDLGHVRLIFVPPGQDIDIRDKIVDLDKRSSPIVPVLIVLLLLAVVGGGAYFYMTKPPAADPDAEAAKLLVEVETDLQNKRWADAIDKSNRVLSTPGVPQSRRDLATTKRTLAESESKHKQVYDRFARAAGTGNYDSALSEYRELPDASVYKGIAREDYDKIFPLFVEKHLQTAAEARAQGNCAEARAQVQAVLDIDPKQVKALAAKDQPCGGSSTSSPVVASNDPGGSSGKSHSDRGDRGNKGRNRPDSVKQPTGETDPGDKDKDKTPVKADVSPADADAALTEAQTNFVNGNYAQAISQARQMTKASPVRAWRIIGGAACHLRDVRLANEAYRHLDAPGRQYMVYVCQREGMTNQGNQFKLAE